MFQYLYFRQWLHLYNAKTKSWPSATLDFLVFNMELLEAL